MKRCYKKDTYANTKVSGRKEDEAGRCARAESPPLSHGETAGPPFLRFTCGLWRTPRTLWEEAAPSVVVWHWEDCNVWR